MRANGAGNVRFRMKGRPLGFGIYMGKGGTTNQPLKLSIFYNGCNCPASTFTTEQQPRDMTTRAVSGPPDVASLDYQENYMEKVYEQNCGTYSVTLSPTYSFLTIAQTGATSATNNLLYYDQLTLASSNPLDIGQYSVLMTVSQESSVPTDGYSNPYLGRLPSISYTFLVTVEPCETALSVDTPSPTMTYTIGDNSLIDGVYSFKQTPDCKYIVNAEIITLPLPAFALHQKNTNNFKIPRTEDRNLAGTYPVTVKGVVKEPKTYQATDFWDRDA